MGVVYAAYDPELDRQVALKLLRPRGRQPEELRRRLLHEAQALARLSHPNVVAVHDVGTSGDAVFLALELVDGTSLEHWMAERYCLYSSRFGRLFRGHVHHLPWPVQPARAEISDNSMTTLPLDGPPLLHFSRGVDVLAWLPEPV